MYETRTLSLIVTPVGEPLFCEGATTVRVDDEAAGPYIVLEQEEHKVQLNFDEWPSIVAAVEQLRRVWDNSYETKG